MPSPRRQGPGVHLIQRWRRGYPSNPNSRLLKAGFDYLEYGLDYPADFVERCFATKGGEYTDLPQREHATLAGSFFDCFRVNLCNITTDEFLDFFIYDKLLHDDNTTLIAEWRILTRLRTPKFETIKVWVIGVFWDSFEHALYIIARGLVWLVFFFGVVDQATHEALSDD